MDNINTISHSQSDMCRAYANGSVGILASGFIWLMSTIVTYQYSAKEAVWALLIGGMFIYPLSILFSKAMGLSGTHTKGNPLGNLAMEGTVFMLMCIPLAFGLSLQHIEWFFPGMLLIIGGRYLTFSSIYGTRLYWFLGAILGIAAFLLFGFNAQPFGSVLTGAIIEITFGLMMLLIFRMEKLNN